MVSILISCKNEPPELLRLVVGNLVSTSTTKDLEIIIVNDGSVNPDGSFRPILPEEIPWVNTKIINNEQSWGVGYSFDRAYEISTGDTLVIMGADIITMQDWDVITYITEPDEIGCACSIGLQPGNYNIYEEGLYARYGAKLLYTIGVNDLPKKSPLRKNPNYTSILEGQFQPKLEDVQYEISCLMGALYWLPRELYKRIHGFDTIEGKRFIGHSAWGCLEPMLSLKVRCYGGKCVMYPYIKAGHIFNRINDIYSVRAIRDDLKWWNRLWTAHTLLSDELRDRVIGFPHPELNLNIARSYIKQNWNTVQQVRERNKQEGHLI